MKKLLFPLIILAIFIASCNDDDDKVAEQLKIDIELIEKYITDSSLTAQSTESGLHYIMEEEGTGDRPDIFAYVTVSYKGYLLDGTVFDEGEVDGNPLHMYVEGWQEGIQLFKQEGKGKLFIPSKLGYGTKEKTKYEYDDEGNISDTLTIPANSVLVFDFSLDSVELRDVNPF